MHLIGVNKQMTPFEKLLIEVLTGQLPGDRPDVKAARAATLAQVILARMAKAEMSIVMNADVVKLQQTFLWTEDHLATIGETDESMTIKSLNAFVGGAATTIAERGMTLVNRAEQPASETAPAARGITAHISLLIPGYAQQMAHSIAMQSPAAGSA
jgi:hypothetical protein